MTLEQHSELLDKIYSLQRHFYDLTRKYYLFGRDTIIDRIASRSPHSVLEVGCGTGRNLFLLESRWRKAQKLARNTSVDGATKPSTPLIAGLDASRAMLAEAEKKRPLKSRVQFAFGYAESFSPEELFQQQAFSSIFFSYSLSMMPEPIAALEHALTLLEPAGEIWIVDFWDQAGYPAWFAAALKQWLALFHVRFDPKLFDYLSHPPSSWKVEIEPVGRQYAYIARLTLG